MTSRNLALVVGFIVVCMFGAAGLWMTHRGPRVASAPTTDAAAPRSSAAVTPKPSGQSEPTPASRQAAIVPGQAAGVHPSPSAGPATTPRAGPVVAAGDPPTFDIVRVEPSGDIVLAGKGTPQSTVALVASGKVVAEGKADANGNFVIIPPPLQPGDHDLTLRQDANADVASGAPIVSRQSVAVKVQKRGGGPAIVALAEPGKATQLLSANPTPSSRAPEQAATLENPAAGRPAEKTSPAGSSPSAVTGRSRPAPDQKLAFRSVELENGDGFYATGSAAPGTHIEIFLNDSRIAGVNAAPDGQWSVKVLKGLAGGRYIVRADATDEGRKVTARAEVAFDVPIAMAASRRQAGVASSGTGVTQVPAVSPEASASMAGGKHPGGTVANVGAKAAAPGQTSAVVKSDAATTTPQDPTRAVPSTPAAQAGAKPSGRMATAPDASIPSDAQSDASASQSKTPSTTASAESHVGAAGDSAIIESLETMRVLGGDNLWRISRTRLGQGHRYTQIYAANATQIRDPNRIYPDQVFVMPRR